MASSSSSLLVLRGNIERGWPGGLDLSAAIRALAKQEQHGDRYRSRGKEDVCQIADEQTPVGEEVGDVADSETGWRHESINEVAHSSAED
jgi:hypothetical protein